MNKERVLRLAKGLGLFGLARWLSRGRLRVLCYHGVWRGPGHYGNFLFMSPARFEQRMRWLAGYAPATLLTLDEAHQRLQAGTLPACPVVITIDDGWQSTYSHMLPVLRELRLPATVYVTSYNAQHQTFVVGALLAYLMATSARNEIEIGTIGSSIVGRRSLSTPAEREAVAQELSALIDQQPVGQRDACCAQVARALDIDLAALDRVALFRIMSAEQVREAAAQGFDIQLHTHRHRIVDAQGEDCLAREIADNRAWLASAIAPSVSTGLHHFCYPSGEHTPACFTVLSALDVKTATTTASGLVSHNTNPYAMPRILDGQAVPQIELEAEMCGLLDLVRRLRARGPRV